MAYISNIKLWESEWDNIVSKKQNINIKQLKKEVNDSYQKDGKKTNFERVNNGDVYQSLIRRKVIKNRCSHINIWKNSFEFEIRSDKQSIEDVLIQGAVKTIIKLFFDKGLFDSFPNADGVSNDFLLVTRHRGDLGESKWCRLMILYININ